MRLQISNESVVAAIADLAAARVVTKTVNWLRTLDAELSGADTPLNSVWEEICVQTQGEESFYWEQYRDTVIMDLSLRIEQIKDFERLALWLQTDEAFNWGAEQDDEQDRSVDQGPPVMVCEIADYLWNKELAPFDWTEYPRR